MNLVLSRCLRWRLATTISNSPGMALFAWGGAAMFFVGGDNALDQRVAHDIAFFEADHGDTFDFGERLGGFDKAGFLVVWQIDLSRVAGDHRFGTMAEAR